MNNMDIGRLMNMTLRAMKYQLAQNFEKKGIPIKVEQFIILKIADKFDDIIQQDIAEMLQVNKSAVLRQINNLEEEQLVARIPDKEDKRKNYIVLTKKGGDLLDRSKTVHDKTVDELLRGIDESDIKSFLKVLQSIRENSDFHKSKEC